MEQAAQQFLRALRGKRSQRAFAQRLGYRGNPMTDWEHGRRYPTAEEALRAAALTKIDVARACSRFAPWARMHKERGAFAVGSWLRQLVAGTSITDLAARSGLSSSAIGRWLSGARRPRLPDFLLVIDAATGRLPDWVAELVPIAEVPALEQRYVATQAARRIAFDEPWTEAVLRVLETPVAPAGPAQGPPQIAARLGISEQQAERALALMQSAGIVRWDGRRYAELRPITVDTHGGKLALRAVKHHWATVAAQRSLEPRRGDVLAYNVLSVSAPDLETIRELLHATFRQVRSIVAASEPAERVALLNLHLVGWNDEPLESIEPQHLRR